MMYMWTYIPLSYLLIIFTSHLAVFQIASLLVVHACMLGVHAPKAYTVIKFVYLCVRICVFVCL